MRPSPVLGRGFTEWFHKTQMRPLPSLVGCFVSLECCPHQVASSLRVRRLFVHPGRVSNCLVDCLLQHGEGGKPSLKVSVAV